MNAQGVADHHCAVVRGRHQIVPQLDDLPILTMVERELFEPVEQRVEHSQPARLHPIRHFRQARLDLHRPVGGLGMFAHVQAGNAILLCQCDAAAMLDHDAVERVRGCREQRRVVERVSGDYSRSPGVAPIHPSAFDWSVSAPPRQGLGECCNQVPMSLGRQSRNVATGQFAGRV